MAPPALRIAVAVVLLAYSGSRLRAVYRDKVCVYFMGLKYCRSEKRFCYYGAIMAHVVIVISMTLNIMRDYRLL
jgi:hypothetical protein